MSLKLFNTSSVILAASVGVAGLYMAYTFLFKHPTNTNGENILQQSKETAHPKESSGQESIMSSAEYAASTVDKKGKLPIHSAVCKRPSDIMEVRRLLALYRKGAAHADSFWGALPLHFAVHKDAGEADAEVVRCLLDAYPEGACTPDGAGFLPLHRAVNRRMIDVEIVELLLQTCPEAATVPTSNGNLALHWATLALMGDPFMPLLDDDMRALELIYRAYPGALHTLNNKGWTVIDICKGNVCQDDVCDIDTPCASIIRSEDMVETILAKFELWGSS